MCRTCRSSARCWRSVTPIDDRRSHWVLRGPGGKKIEWDSEITADKPGERMAWHSISGDVKHAGTVRFERAPARSWHVRQREDALPAARRAHRDGAREGGSARIRTIRFAKTCVASRASIETGEVPSTRGQSSGRRSFIRTHDARRSRIERRGQCHESELLERRERSARGDRAGSEDHQCARCDHPRHVDRDLRLGPAPVQRLHPDDDGRATSSAMSSWARWSRSGRVSRI